MYPKSKKRQKITKHIRKEVDVDIIPAPLSNLLSQIKNEEKEIEVITKTDIDSEKGWRVTTIFEDVAYQIDDSKHMKKQNHVFWWKFASELQNEAIPFRGHALDVEWYQVKETLETEFHFNKVKQQKRNLCHTSLLAFRLDDWKKIQSKQDILNGLCDPLQAHDTFVKDEKIILMRLPSNIVHSLYKEVVSLTFDDTLTEEEKIARITDFDGGMSKHQKVNNNKVAIDYSKHPPLGYYCHNCGSPDHFVQNCDKGRRMRPKGIPKMFLEKTEIVSDKDHALLLEDGTVVRARLLVDGKMQ